MSEFRNPTYNQSGGIDLEVNHPQYGWMPFTANPNDGELYGRSLFAEASAGEVAPYVPPSPPPVDLVAYAAEKRWQVETGGITVGGAAIDTSRESQAMITGAYAYSQANPDETISFKAASGFVSLDAATLAAIATAVGAHVQACFAAEAAVLDDIGDGAITTTEEIDGYAWPE